MGILEGKYEEGGNYLRFCPQKRRWRAILLHSILFKAIRDVGMYERRDNQV